MTDIEPDRDDMERSTEEAWPREEEELLAWTERLSDTSLSSIASGRKGGFQVLATHLHSSGRVVMARCLSLGTVLSMQVTGCETMEKRALICGREWTGYLLPGRIYRAYGIIPGEDTTLLLKRGRRDTCVYWWYTTKKVTAPIPFMNIDGVVVDYVPLLYRFASASCYGCLTCCFASAWRFLFAVLRVLCYFLALACCFSFHAGSSPMTS